MGLIMLAVVAVGGLLGYRVLTEDDDGSGSTSVSSSSAVSPSGSAGAATPGRPPTGAASALPSASASASASASGSASASPSAADTGPGSGTRVPELQAAAERAAASQPQASLVALNMKNGEIVATVRNGPGLSGATAPGSTFKIVSSALLLKKGVVTPGKKVPCPKEAFAGKPFHNVNGFAIPDATFREDFAESCNTAFVNLRSQIGDGELAQFSKDYFGLNSDAWRVGEGGTVDGIVPPSSGDSDKAAQMIGQGAIQMNPMTMASVVATAVTGEFHQPILVRGGTGIHQARQKLPAGVVRDIKDMMRACATTGTAKETFRDMPGVGAKTGTAEVGGSTDAWMVAYRGDIAVAVIVPGGESGSKAAGPIVRGFLSAVPA